MIEKTLGNDGRKNDASDQMDNCSTDKNTKFARHLFFGGEKMKFGGGVWKRNGSFWLLAAILMVSIGKSAPNRMMTEMANVQTDPDSKRPKTAFLLADARNTKNAENWQDTFDGTVTLPSGVKLEMVKIKAGEFMMGSPKEELGHEDDEVLHTVKLTQDFWIGKTEVTQNQYEAVMRRNPSKFRKGGNYPADGNHPVENITWTDAMDFCRELTRLERETGRLSKDYEYTLPTEAQWEYACRADTTTALNNGKNLKGGIFHWWGGIHDDESLWAVAWYDYHNTESSTHAVGLKKPNKWGLYDMHGNVREWCHDRYGSYPAGVVTDPTGPSDGGARVLRGGGWGNRAEKCRAAERDWAGEDYNWWDTGFRIVLVPVQR